MEKADVLNNFYSLEKFHVINRAKILFANS